MIGAGQPAARANVPNYTLGKDYTVSGLSGVSDLTVTREVDRVDVTTRDNAKPFKMTASGLTSTTFECTVLADGDTKFSIGKAYSVTVDGAALGSLVCLTATREEPQSGVINYKLTLRPGEESEVCDQVEIGPGDYRSCT